MVGELNCDPKVHKCHCYGEICLVNKPGEDKCSEGAVYRSGTPVCNKLHWGEKGGDVVCKALGFNGHESTKKEAKR